MSDDRSFDESSDVDSVFDSIFDDISSSDAIKVGYWLTVFQNLTLFVKKFEDFKYSKHLLMWYFGPVVLNRRSSGIQ